MNAPLIIKDQPHTGIIRLVFNRPHKLNALSTPLLREFEQLLNELDNDLETRIVIIEGAGDKAFVAGADIQEYQGGKHREFNAYQLESRRIFDKLEALSKPTIASVQGYALGGGFEIALCCDLIICAEDARFGLPEGRLGLTPGGGGTQRLTRAVGRYEAANVMLAGWRISGQRAYELGLAAAVCPSVELRDTVLKRAKAMLEIAPLAQRNMKYLIREGVDAALPVAKTLEQRILFDIYMSRDAQEGIDAFLEKRQPEFKGE